MVGAKSFARSASTGGRKAARSVGETENPIRVLWEVLLWVILIGIVGLCCKLGKGARWS